ncbi:MAG TPA: Smr/MutS family protein [Syntrophorhabdaceae bacterium]|nr:Smr/MutS family protein [Syntrophorhabdaceae bacterium]
MIDKTLSYIDYTKLIDFLHTFSTTPFVKETLSQIKPLNKTEEIAERQDKIEAVIEVMKWDGKIPLYNASDIRDILKRLSIKDALLEIRELLQLSDFLRSCQETLNFLKKTFNKKQFIEDILARIKPLPAVYQKITKTINIEGFIEDTATYELSRIRTDLHINRERIRKLLERIMEREAVRPIIQDVYISLRNSRYVIPLKPNFNQVLKGIVHDYSHSLKTSFVEPMECVELNNAINILENEEKEEEKRILKDLTAFAARFKEEIEANLEAIKELDIYQTLALFSIQFNCVRPEVLPGISLDIKAAVNPFIYLSRKDKTVPIDIFMEKEKKAMIISGPNAGGKTAALKTAGLLSAMALAGLFIPAAGRPQVPLFSHIFAIIGDEQDISMELSSFTAHMKTITELYNRAGGDELILIDEIGGNTEPQEASAISMAVIDAFVEKGSRVIVTTHLNLLKSYGYTKPFAINVATDFDPDTMRPRYRLTYGLAGYSNAINVAKNISVPERIIEKSYEYLGSQEHMLNELISSLKQKKHEVEHELEEAKKIKEDLRKRLSLLKEKRDEYLRSLEEKYRIRLDELELEIEEIRKEIAKRDRASLKSARQKVATLRREHIREAGPEHEDIKIGDYVQIKNLGIKGYIADLDEDGETAEVVMGNLRTKINRGFISRLPKNEKKSMFNEKPQVSVEYEHINEPQINIMGMRVEEALEELDRFVDRAVVQGVQKVRVLHGIGTGRLMNAVRKHFADTKYIKGIIRDEKNTGITILELI